MASRPVDSARFVVFDLEARGTDVVTDAPIEIAAIRYIDGREAGRFNMLVNPGRSVHDPARA